MKNKPGMYIVMTAMFLCFESMMACSSGNEINKVKLA